MIIRCETSADIHNIHTLVTAAFKGALHTSGTEAAIVAALRESGGLTLSLVAERYGELFGHVAFSPVAIDGKHTGWFGLGPVAVRKEVQRQGIGRALIDAGLKRLSGTGAGGCVVLGDPAYYARFGFETDPSLRFPGVPEEFFQRLTIRGASPKGVVVYAPPFY